MPDPSPVKPGRTASALRPALVAFGEESLRLAAVTTGVWARLLPRLIGLTLLGWVAYHGAVFAGAELAHYSAWLLLPALSIGVVLRLATVVVALRVVATELGAPALLRQVAPAEAVEDDRDRSLSRLLGITLLPFLAVYAAFGYVDTFARDVVLLSTYRFGFGELLQELNPLNSATTATITVVLVVALYLARRLLERWQERTGGLLPALLAALVEASGLFVVLLSAFRLLEGAQLWLGDRRMAQWWRACLDWATGWLHFDVPDVLLRAWTFLAGTIWPVLWDLVSQPLAWLTLAALVFGSRVLTLGDVLHADAAGDGAVGRAERLRLALAGAAGPRRVLLRLQQTFAGDVDDKYLPTWRSLRLVLHAGWPFLGAYILLFGLLGFLGDWSVDAVKSAIGGQPVSVWIRVLPFLGLLPDVLVMSLQLALLGAAFVRILQLRSPQATRAAPAAATGRGSRLAEAAVVAVLVVAFTVMTVARPNPDAAVRNAGVGERARYAGGFVQVDGVQLGAKVLMLPSKDVEASPVMFVAVHATVTRTGAAEIRVQPHLTNGSREYDPQSWGSSVLAPEPGFSEGTDFVFEILAADANEGLLLEFETRQLLVYYPDVVSVPLGLGATASVAAAHDTVVVTSGTQKAVA